MAEANLAESAIEPGALPLTAVGQMPGRAATPPLRLAYLDGLRAVAATYVVMFHAVIGFSAPSLTGSWRFLRRVFAYGHEAVAIFIVLSGYSLMLPVIRRHPESHAAPFWPFMRRRAWRILPPYFVALGVSLALLATIPPLRVASRGTIWDDSLPGLELGAIVSHLLLLHNWFPAWKVQINGPLWSVATEWQIYFCFPLLLLPVWRRQGMWGALAIAVVVAYGLLYVAPLAADAAVAWYLVLFTFGMIAAALGFPRPASPRSTPTPRRWGLISGASWAGCFLFSTAAAKLWFAAKPLTDVLVGFATATLLLHLTGRALAPNTRRGLLLGALESRPLVALGHFSYSLYLTHLPIVALCALGLAPLRLPPPLGAFALLFVGGLAALGFAFCFYWGVERHFLARRQPG